eukprot:TRINITY_DN56118_c0_g1_i1.p1 TRINITY_DN56118_c0_g1~~TRINITY_DN56118_c0_g1_i1.p1  ORF type:complete len:684 (-),score=157.60 TRINITY_DN56118_c0_g1_i1:182-2233(-)
MSGGDAAAARGDTRALCKAAWTSLCECQRLLNPGTSLRSKVALLYLKQTVDAVHGLGASAVEEVCVSGGDDGFSVAIWLRDVLFSLALSLLALEECSSAAKLIHSQIFLQRLEHRLLKLHHLLHRLVHMEVKSWQEALSDLPPAELLSSGDFVVFWKNAFSQRLRVSCEELARALQAVRGIDAKTSELLLSWLRFHGGGGGEAGDSVVDLADAALTLDVLGLYRGIAFCTSWQDLAGHALITSLRSGSDRGRRAVMRADDIALARKERECSVLVPDWSRESLRRCRPLFLALTALGIANICDVDRGLVILFEEPEIALGLVPDLMDPPPHDQEPGAFGSEMDYGASQLSRMRGFNTGMDSGTTFDKKKSKLAEAVISAVRKADVKCQDVSFVSPGRDLPSARVVAEKVGHARDRHRALIELKSRKLWALHDFLHVFEVLDSRQRTAHEKRVRTCDPSFRSEAWPQLHLALEDQKIKEEQVVLRKHQLGQLEAASDDQNQIAHIKAMLHEVTQAEAEQEESRQWLVEQEAKWIQEEENFQEDRRRRDLACRQRIAAMLLEQRLRQQQRCQLIREVSRIEDMLLDIEDSFSTSRQRVHEYDQELRDKIGEKETLLGSLTQALSSMKEESVEAQSVIAEGHESLERMEQIRELQQEKLQQMADIEVLERKIEALKAKHSVVVLAVP